MTIEIQKTTTTTEKIEVEFPLYYEVRIGTKSYCSYYIPSQKKAFVVSMNDGIQKYPGRADDIIERFFSCNEGVSTRQLTKAEFDAYTQQVADHFLKLITDKP